MHAFKPLPFDNTLLIGSTTNYSKVKTSDEVAIERIDGTGTRRPFWPATLATLSAPWTSPLQALDTVSADHLRTTSVALFGEIAIYKNAVVGQMRSLLATHSIVFGMTLSRIDPPAAARVTSPAIITSSKAACIEGNNASQIALSAGRLAQNVRV